MGATSSPDLATAPFESGMRRLVLQSEILSRGTMPRCNPLLTLPMGVTLSPDPTIAPFESGMRRRVLRSEIPSRGAGLVQSIAYSSDGQHGSLDKTASVWYSFPYVYIRPSPRNPIYPALCAMPEADGWVRDSKGGLLYWVPPDIRTTVHSPALLTIPLTSRNRSVSLDFDDFVFGTSWTQIFKNAVS